MKKNLNRWFTKHRMEAGMAVLFFPAGLFIGFLIRPALNFQLQFDDKVDAGEVFSAIVTILVAWFVASILDKQKHTEHTSKDMLVKRVEELYTYTSKIAEHSTSGDFLYTTATSSLNRINKTFERIYSQVGIIGISVEDNIKKDIASQIDKLEDLLTNTPALLDSDAAKAAVKVENGKLHFNNERVLQIDDAFDNLKERISSLELTIYRS